MARRWHAGPESPSLPIRQAGHRTRPGLPLSWWSPPAGIEPATPSLPWNHQEPLFEPPLSQVAPDRPGRSYRFYFDAVMRSLPHQSSAPNGSFHQSVTAESAASRIAAASTSTRDEGIPRLGQAQMKASGPGGGRGRTRYSMSQAHRSGDEPLATRPVPRAIAQHRTVGVRPAGADGGRVKVGHLSGHPQTRPSTRTHHLATNGRGDGRTPGTARIPAAPWQLVLQPHLAADGGAGR
jgi:hypothetical protein